jgi:2-polyprenyl-6-methoxyphenol hydroxylase-like FAD-dependent oxidoreductase
MVLALLLARRRVPVALLEAHPDFDRDFRGDTLHPAILEILNQLGLAERLHKLPHVKWLGPSLVTASGPVPLVDFRRLRTRFPYIMLLPQERFLEFLAEEASRYPQFRLTMRANVQRLVEEDGAVRGVRYRSTEGWQEVRAPLTVGADGRFSRVRRLAGIEPVVLAPPMELLWFRLPRLPGDEREFDSVGALVRNHPFAILNGEGESAVGFLHRGQGFLLGVFNRLDHWQVGYIYREGTYPALKAAGIAAFRRAITELEPRLARHLAYLTAWHQLAPLSVAFSRCRRWYKPGLLLIGDAAHVMTPAAGAGIKYAIEDGVEAANVLAVWLRSGRVRLRNLAEVQRRREWPTRLMQWAGALAQQTILSRALGPRRGTGGLSLLPFLARVLSHLPVLRSLPARFAGFGLWRVRVEDPSEVVSLGGPPSQPLHLTGAAIPVSRDVQSLQAAPAGERRHSARCAKA